MYTTLTRKPWWTHSTIVAASFVLLIASNLVLEMSYAASRHPVSFAQGQTTFDGEQIKSYYATMSSTSTLDVYVRTQLIDFVFIAAVALSGYLLATLLRRIHRDTGFGGVTARLVGIALPVGAGFDVIENLVSFVMLADPAGFPGWLAIPYSTAAVLKFGFMGLGMLSAVLSVLWIVIARSRNSVPVLTAGAQAAVSRTPRVKR